MTTLIVPDANVLYSDPFLERPLIRTILAAEEKAGLRLLIPAVVIDELRHQVEEKLDDPAGKAKKLQQEFPDLTGLSPNAIGFQLTAGDKQSILDRFNNRIEEFREEQRILNYPFTSLQELAWRSIRLQRPFLKGDRGFRDTLFWLSIKEYLAETPDTASEVVVGTDDGGFYDRNKTTLHESMARELEALGTWQGSVIAQQKLKYVIDHSIRAKLSNTEWKRVSIGGGTTKGLCTDDEYVIQVANDWITEHMDDFRDSFDEIRSKYAIMGFELLHSATLARVKQALDLGNGEVLVDSEWVGYLLPLLEDLPLFWRNDGCLSDYLGVSMKFSLSSLLELEQEQPIVLSHEVTCMNIEILRSEMDAGVGPLSWTE